MYMYTETDTFKCRFNILAEEHCRWCIQIGTLLQADMWAQMYQSKCDLNLIAIKSMVNLHSCLANYIRYCTTDSMHKLF